MIHDLPTYVGSKVIWGIFRVIDLWCCTHCKGIWSKMQARFVVHCLDYFRSICTPLVCWMNKCFRHIHPSVIFWLPKIIQFFLICFCFCVCFVAVFVLFYFVSFPFFWANKSLHMLCFHGFTLMVGKH